MSFRQMYNDYLSNKLGRKLLELEGITPEQKDIARMTEKYFSQNMADMSIDENANINEEINPNSYQSEVTKGLLKYEGYRL